MTKDNIITLPNQHLRQRSKRVIKFDKELEQLIDGMKSAAIDWETSRPHEISAALAAVQIDKLVRVIIIRDDVEEKSDATFTVLVNPEIVKYEGEIIEDYEGCLSVSNVYGKVPRHSKVRVRALDPSGNELRFKADGFLARVLQHEIDHTNGIVFIDHIKSKQDAFFELDKKGELQPLDYEAHIAKNRILWD